MKLSVFRVSASSWVTLALLSCGGEDSATSDTQQAGGGASDTSEVATVPGAGSQGAAEEADGNDADGRQSPPPAGAQAGQDVGSGSGEASAGSDPAVTEASAMPTGPQAPPAPTVDAPGTDEPGMTAPDEPALDGPGEPMDDAEPTDNGGAPPGMSALPPPGDMSMADEETDPPALPDAIPPVEPEVGPSQEPKGMSDRAADGEACSVSNDCASGACEGVGCGDMAGICVGPLRPCTADLAQYCGCDGVTFTGSGSCPSGRFQYEGPCDSGAEPVLPADASHRLEFLGGDVGLDVDATAVVLLWGADRLLADAPATLLGVYQVGVDALPTALELDIPAQPHTLIEGRDVPAQDAVLYFTVYVDVDSDGEICPGDYAEAFGANGPQMFEAAVPNSVSFELELKGEGYSCRSAVPD